MSEWYWMASKDTVNILTQGLYDYIEVRLLGAVVQVRPWFGASGYNMIEVRSMVDLVKESLIKVFVVKRNGVVKFEVAFWSCWTRRIEAERFDVSDPGVFGRVFDCVVGFLVKDRVEG